MIYKDPKSVEASEFKFDICGSVQEKVPKNTYGIINKTIPAGRCVYIQHLGSQNEIDCS